MERAEHHPWRTAAIIAVVLVAVGAAVWRVRACGSHEPAIRYELATVDRGAIEAKVTATGTVNPIKTVQVGSQISGRIEELGADFNSVVEPGQVIAQIDPRPFQATVNQATANLHAANAEVRKARAQAIDARRIARRNQQLAAQQLIARQQADTTEANAIAAEGTLEAARATVIQAEAELESAKLSLSYTRIVSPIHGTVISRTVDVGQTVAASFNAPILFLIGEDLTKMQVDTNIAEADVGRLEQGMTATFTVDAYPARRFRGTIREVRNAPQNIQNVITYNAVIDVANPDLRLKPGMTANVEVVYANRKDVLRVPNAALRFRPPVELAGKVAPLPLGKKLVWIERATRLVPVVIEPGVSDGTFTELLAGTLVEGDKLVTEAITKGPRNM